MSAGGWLEVERGEAPLLVSLPHTGGEIPPELEARMVSGWLARKDADHAVERLYGFARELGATTLRTTISRSVIDVNRDPSGAALYPGQFTTGLCPLTTFDGERLYAPGQEPDPAESARRSARFFAPYHGALEAELARLRAQHARVVLYDAHAIRSRVPRLFKGTLPQLNIGTFAGKSCDRALTQRVEQACRRSSFSWITDGRFQGGWTTRHYGQLERGVHAVQMEIACRAYLLEPEGELDATNWPPSYDAERAAPLQAVLREVLQQCLAFATQPLDRE
jgi:N-formylglutamate deformylase